MPVELEMPELAESVIEGEIVKWLVKEGDHVAGEAGVTSIPPDCVANVGVNVIELATVPVCKRSCGP